MRTSRSSTRVGGMGLGQLADGTIFTTFLDTLNAPGACFASQCDWRLPTPEELQTILSQAYPCATYPCVDGTFGLTAANYYWTRSTRLTDATYARVVSFFNGLVDLHPKSAIAYVRAVRGGL
jgi:hypothetical protein